MEEAKHFLDGLKVKYMHQIEQAIEDWDYQDFSPDKRCPLLENEEGHNVRDDPDEKHVVTSGPFPTTRKSWVGLTSAAELDDFDCIPTGVKVSSYEDKLVGVCTPPGGIRGIPDAASIERFFTHIPHLETANVTAAFAARLQSDEALRFWQVRAKTIVLMQMLVEIKPFAVLYIEAFQTSSVLLQQLDALRTGTQQVIREGARKLLSLIHSNGTNPAYIPEQIPASEHLPVRHLALDGTKKQKKTLTKPAQIQPQSPNLATSPDKLAKGKGVRLELLKSKSTALLVQAPKLPMVMSPKVSQAAQASWRRRKSISKGECEDDNLMPYQENSLTRQASISRLDSGRSSAFSFVQSAVEV